MHRTVLGHSWSEHHKCDMVLPAYVRFLRYVVDVRLREGCEGAEVCEVGPIRRGPPDTKVLNEPSRYKVFIKSDSR